MQREQQKLMYQENVRYALIEMHPSSARGQERKPFPWILSEAGLASMLPQLLLDHSQPLLD